jgi:type IV pilus assembly protein PilW
MSIPRRHRAETSARRHGRSVQDGFTLIELSISILIGLFLIGGLLTLEGGTKRTFGAQNQMAQLQDSERLAMTLITDVIQSAGYFYGPTVNTAAGLMPVTAPYTFAGQAISGTGAFTAAAPGDTIAVRYLTAGGDAVINCIGNTNAAAKLFVNQFNIATVAGVPYLQCVLKVGAAAATTSNLVSGVTSLNILYGVQTNPGVNNGSIDCYLDAPQVSAGNYWGNVISVKVTLTFTNPLFGQFNQPATIPFTRVIALMSKTGVST